jgi:hypothetical protein
LLIFEGFRDDIPWQKNAARAPLIQLREQAGFVA